MDSSTASGTELESTEKSRVDCGLAKEQNPAVPPAATNVLPEVAETSRGVKRPAEAECHEDNEVEDGNDIQNGDDDGDVEATAETTSHSHLSKNQQRKLKRRKIWNERKAERIHKRKEKRHDRQERKRLDREAEIALAAQEGREPVLSQKERHRNPAQHTKVPVTIVIDCQFEKYMRDNEIVSMSSQITRCYSDNRGAEFPVHLTVSSYGGKLKERYETTLANSHKNWKGVTFTEDDFIEASNRAKEVMSTPEGGRVVALLNANEGKDVVSWVDLDVGSKPKDKRKKGPAPEPQPEPEDVDKSIVYLTADSPYTLNYLEPNTCYVIGGIVDRNREKGLCYKVARERKVRTAKLPIGEYMVLRDRHVLATNHVVEIMLRWLELGDWGAAFMKVIPARKGGALKDGESAASEAGPEIDGVVGQDYQAAVTQGQTRESTDTIDHQNSTAGQEKLPDVGSEKREAGTKKEANL